MLHVYSKSRWKCVRGMASLEGARIVANNGMHAYAGSTDLVPDASLSLSAPVSGHYAGGNRTASMSVAAALAQPERHPSAKGLSSSFETPSCASGCAAACAGWSQDAQEHASVRCRVRGLGQIRVRLQHLTGATALGCVATQS